MNKPDKRDFNQAAETWDENPTRIELAHAIANAVLRNIPISKDMDVLDYGAGTGLVTLALQPHVCTITAADSSQGMLAKLNDKVSASATTNVQTILLDLESDPAPEQRFGLVVSSMTTHHIEDVQALIRKFHELLSVGGYLAIADLDLDDGEFHSDPTGVKHNGLDRQEIEQIFNQAGFNEFRIVTAHTLIRPVMDKAEREFTIFLAIGKRIS